MLRQIKASAGSGKTYTLTRHFLSLLALATPDGSFPACALAAPDGGYELGGILAATFTNKAAAEMKARVIRDLKSAALEREKDLPFSPGEAEKWVASILRRYDTLNIRTIDSLLAMLARAGALTLGLPPDFAPVFDDEEYFAPLYDSLLDRLAGGDPALVMAVRDACRGLLFHGGAKGFLAGDRVRDRLLEVVRFALGRGEAEGPLALSEETLEAVHAHMRTLRENVEAGAAAMLAALREEELAPAENFRKWTESCLDVAFSPMPRESAYAAKTCLDECLLKASRGCAGPRAETAFFTLSAAFAEFMRDIPPLRAALELAPFAWLTGPLAEKLAERQAEEGRVPAALMPGLARRILEGEGGVSDAFCRLGNRLTHLLFDEFQDTSREQWGSMAPLAVECLSKGGSLTYVGDVKQAIYGWRGGDAALFDAALEDEELTRMLGEGPEKRLLKQNWRSAPHVVAFNNAVFGPLDTPDRARAVLEAMLPADTPPAMLAEGTAALAGAFTDARQIPAREDAAPGYVRLTRIEGGSADDMAEGVREALVALLRDDLLPRRGPGDIAVLVRRNSEASDVAAWLTAEGIPVVTEHSFLLDAHPLIQRLAACLAFLEYPADDESFWSFIAGPELFPPLSGATEGALFAWLAEARRTGGKRGAAADAGQPLYRLFARDYPPAWERYIAPFFDRAGLMSAYDTLREIIRCYRVFERLPEHAPFVRRFLEVADAAERQGFSSLSAFLEFWNDKGRQEKVPMPEGMNAVRILTMHKAKGLEFPVVVVPFHHGGSVRRPALVEAEVAGFTLLTRLTRHLGEPYYRQALREVLEQINLLYVAWTRPTDELHAFLSTSPSQRRQPGLARALPFLLEDFSFSGEVCELGERGGSGVPEAEKTEKPAPPATAAPGRADSWAHGGPSAPFRPMEWLPRLNIFRNPVGDLAFGERKRGLLAHACLENLAVSGDEETDARNALERALRSFPLPVPDAGIVEREMLDMLRWFLSLPGSAGWIEKGRPEVSLMDADGRVYRVDLLVDEGEAGFLSVEYKTGRPGPAHEEQVRRYLGLLAAATGRPARGVLVYLDLHETRPVGSGS